jgi:hypothetical protein
MKSILAFITIGLLSWSGLSAAYVTTVNHYGNNRAVVTTHYNRPIYGPTTYTTYRYGTYRYGRPYNYRYYHRYHNRYYRY